MLSEAFEEVYVINMPRRADRWEQFMNRLPNDWPFKQPVRYEALDGGIVTPPAWWNGGNGGWGCYRTHIRIWEDCLNRNIQSVLILEDDAVCIEGFREKTEQFWKHLPDDWEMLYLGGQHIQENLRLPRKLNDWVYQPFNINRCHCYGFRGRPMLEKAYRHLHDFQAWNVPHHVDHYLGELHKKMDHGIYVPREWLVAQSEGQSDICGEKLGLRLFPSSEETVYPTVDFPGVAIVGGYFSGTSTIAGTMRQMGCFLGSDLGQPESSHPHFFEDIYLGEICRGCFGEPWLTNQLPYSDRVNHLRRWAGLQCREKPKQILHFCGKHPILSLMGEELMEAWNSPKFICVERPDEEAYQSMRSMSWAWHPDAAKHAFELLRKTRERFFTIREPDLLRISYGRIKENAKEILAEICDFLDIHPSHDQQEKSIAWMKKHDNDLCFM